MPFSSLTFLYLFLPASLLLFTLTPQKAKNIVLTALSALFYLLAQPEFFGLYAGTLLLQFLFSLGMTKAKDAKGKRLVRNLAVLENTVLLLYFSVSNQLFGTTVPLGTMVVAFTAIGYFVDVEKGDGEAFSSFFDLAVFLGFFGKLYRGPLLRLCDDTKTQPESRLTQVGDGLYLFLRGLAKYVLLAQPLGVLHSRLVEANGAEASVIGAWGAVISLGMGLFYDLSGFSDMARGLGNCFGMELPKNFYFPFQSPSVTEFLDRFNMTVTGFFRHYVYDSLRTKENSALQFSVDTLLVAMLCGVWFGVRMNFVLWGIYIGFFIILEKLFLGRILRGIPKIFARVYTFCVTMFSMTFFTTAGDFTVGKTLRAMFGVGAEATTEAVSYVLSENVLVLIVGFFFLTSLLSTGARFLHKKAPALHGIFAVAESAILLVLITGELL